MIIESIAKIMDMLPRPKDKSAQHLARRLGYFSIGLGLLELAAPHRVARFIGMHGGQSLIALYGIRELGTGLGILASRDATPFIRARVAGDGLDILTLLAGFGRSDRKLGLFAALGSVAMITAIDLVCAETLSQDRKRQRSGIPDYSGRTGLPRGAAQARGAAVKTLGEPRILAVMGGPGVGAHV